MILLPPPAPLTLAAVGDIMLGSDYPSRAYLPPKGTDLLREVGPTLRGADVTFGNLEGPLASGGRTGKSGPRSYAFRTPPAYATYLKRAGFDFLSLANNHASDFGAAGRATTRAALTKQGIAFAGNRGEITVLNVKGSRIAFVCFAHNRVSDNLNDVAGARALVRVARTRGEIVVVSFHGGAEGSGAARVPKGAETYLGEARGDLRRFAHAVVDEGADLVLGHGPHVPRAMEVYKGRLVAYSLGNFATYGLFTIRGQTALAPILMAKLMPGTGVFAGGRIVSARQVGKGMPRLDPSGAAAREIKRLSALDFPATGVRIGSGGALSRR